MKLLSQPAVLLVTLSSLVSLLQSTSAHSWLECTDYRIDSLSEPDAKTWDPKKCAGRARCTGSLPDTNYQFGHDSGFDHHASTCQCNRGSDAGTTAVALYTPGQRVCLAYPAKNHVAAPCTNAFIPDAGLRITRTSVNPTSDDDGSKTDYTQGNGNHVSGTIDYKGFQHCPAFCENLDKALCTTCFDLETDLAPGNYTFKWIWDFHGDNDIYTSCWEATVGRGTGQRPAQVATVATRTPVSYAAVEATSAPTPTTTSSSPSPSPTPTVYAAVAADCEDELDVAGDDDADCENELGMADDVDCEEELDMATGAGETGAEADPGYGNIGNGQEANYASPSTPVKPDAQSSVAGGHEAAPSQGTGGNYGGGGGHEDVKSLATGTGGGYGHEAAQGPPASGSAQETAPSPTTGNSPPALTVSNNNSPPGSTQHGHEYGHSHGGHYSHSHGNVHPAQDNSKPGKNHEGQPPATSTGGTTESAPKPEVDPGCEQGLTLAKDKPAETTGAATSNNNNAKPADTPVAYPAKPQGLEAAASSPAYTPETGAEAQNPKGTPPASTPETGADADHGQGHGYGDAHRHQAPSQPASDGIAATTPEPDCDETLPVAETVSASTAGTTTPESASDGAVNVSGEATEDPDCDGKLPYAYDNAPPAVQGEANSTEVQGEAEDCDKGIPIASEGQEKGGHHGPHHQQGESYSFKSEENSLKSGLQTGVVEPYRGE